MICPMSQFSLVVPEAKHYYVNGEELFLSGEFLEVATEYQNNAMEKDDRVANARWDTKQTGSEDPALEQDWLFINIK